MCTGGSAFGSSAALRWVAPSGREYFILNNQCIEPRTGKVIWETKGASLGAASPALTPNRIVFNGAGMKPAVRHYDIGSDGPTLVADLGKDHKVKAGLCSNLTLGDYLYIHGGPLRAVELATGKVLEVSAMPGMYWDEGASTTAMDGRILGWARPPKEFRQQGGDRRTVYMVNADPADFRLMGRVGPMNCGRSLTPTVAFGRLYLRGSERLSCYDLRESVAMREQLARRLAGMGKAGVEAAISDAGKLAALFKTSCDRMDPVGMSASCYFLRELGDDAVAKIVPLAMAAMTSTNYPVSAAACRVMFPDGKARTPRAEAVLLELVMQGNGAAVVTFDRLDKAAKARSTARFEKALRSGDTAAMYQAATFLTKVDAAGFRPVVVRYALSLIYRCLLCREPAGVRGSGRRMPDRMEPRRRCRITGRWWEPGSMRGRRQEPASYAYVGSGRFLSSRRRKVPARHRLHEQDTPGAI